MRILTQRRLGLVGVLLIERYLSRIYAQLEAQLIERCSIVATEGHWHTSKLLSDNDFLQESIQSIMGATDMRHMLAGA